jgi:hypothetical protein
MDKVQKRGFIKYDSVMVNCCVFFQIQTEYLNIIYTSFGFKGLVNTETFHFSSHYIEKEINLP